MNVLTRFPIAEPRLEPVNEFAPKVITCTRKGGCDSEHTCKAYGECKVSRTGVWKDWPETDGPVNLPKLEAELGRNRLAEIATLVAALTYGEMIEFADGLWSLLPQDRPVKPQDFPAILHRWSKNRS